VPVGFHRDMPADPSAAFWPAGCMADINFNSVCSCTTGPGNSTDGLMHHVQPGGALCIMSAAVPPERRRGLATTESATLSFVVHKEQIGRKHRRKANIRTSPSILERLKEAMGAAL